METIQLQWTKSLSVNDKLVDNQHKKLFALTNELFIHADAKVNSEIINETIYELLNYAKTHFHSEEELMRKYNYPKLEEHKKKHDDFIYHIAIFSHDVIQRKETMVEELINFLNEWLIQHISIDDQDYKNYI